MNFLLPLLLLLPLSARARESQHPLIHPSPTLEEILDGNHNLDLLNLLYQQNSSVLSHLVTDEAITFLAPSDDAFRKLLEGHNARHGDKPDTHLNETLKLYSSLLSYHTLRGRYTFEQLFSPSPRTIETFLDNPEFVADGARSVVRTEMKQETGWVYGGVGEGSFLRGGDITLSNGLLHIIDSFLRLPIAVSGTADEVGGNDFATTLRISGMRESVDDAARTTVFVPKAMFINDGITAAEVIGIVNYHVVDSRLIFSEELRDVNGLSTVHGEKLQVSVRGGDIYIDESKVVKADVITKTGVVHVLDRMLDPRGPSFLDPTTGKICRCLSRGCRDDKTSCDGSAAKPRPPKRNRSSRVVSATSKGGVFVAAMICWFAAWDW